MKTGATFGSRWRTRLCAGVSPAALAARTKSLCCTRRSSGRVTLAMLTPKPMPTAQITTQSEPPQTEEIIIAINSTGKAIRMSTSTATVSRIHRAVSAPSAARAIPTAVATMPAPTLTNTVVRAPAISRLRMSRPVSSVPRTWGQLGGSHRSPMSEACGSNGVQRSEISAVMTITRTTTMPKRPVEVSQRRASQRGFMRTPADEDRSRGAGGRPGNRRPRRIR